MSVSIRATITITNLTTVCPFDIWPEISTENFQTIELGGVQSWIKGNEDTSLVLVVDHYFPNDALFASYKTVAQQHIPLWEDSTNTTESASYASENGITIVWSEPSNPDLSGYERIDEARSSQRSL